MSKIAIITDSTAYLKKEELISKDIHVLPLSIEFEGKVYVEGEDITASQFYEMIRGAKELPKSSQPTVGRTLELLETLSKDYDAAIAIHISSDISGTYQTTYSLDGEFDNFKVYAVDSRRTCGAQAQLVREACRLVELGKEAEEIVTALQKMIEQQNAYFLVDDLMNLQKGGRLSASSALIGSMLSIKPILTINGTITAAEKIRTFKKGLQRVLELSGNEISNLNGPVTATIHHANNIEVAGQLEAALKDTHSGIEVHIADFGPVIGTHLGEKAVGIIFGPTTSENL